MLVCYIKKILQIQRFVFERKTNKQTNKNNNTFYWDSKYKYIVITLFSHPQIAYNLIEERGVGEGWKDKFTIQGSTY